MAAEYAADALQPAAVDQATGVHAVGTGACDHLVQRVPETAEREYADRADGHRPPQETAPRALPRGDRADAGGAGLLLEYGGSR